MVIAYPGIRMMSVKYTPDIIQIRADQGGFFLGKLISELGCHHGANFLFDNIRLSGYKKP